MLERDTSELLSGATAVRTVTVSVFVVLLSGSTVYTCMLNRHGGVEGDLTVSAIEPGDGVSVHDPAFQGNSHLTA